PVLRARRPGAGRVGGGLRAALPHRARVHPIAALVIQDTPEILRRRAAVLDHHACLPPPQEGLIPEPAGHTRTPLHRHRLPRMIYGIKKSRPRPTMLRARRRFPMLAWYLRLASSGLRQGGIRGS